VGFGTAGAVPGLVPLTVPLVPVAAGALAGGLFAGGMVDFVLDCASTSALEQTRRQARHRILPPRVNFFCIEHFLPTGIYARFMPPKFRTQGESVYVLPIGIHRKKMSERKTVSSCDRLRTARRSRGCLSLSTLVGVEAKGCHGSNSFCIKVLAREPAFTAPVTAQRKQ
jgi:hypothetical protein